MTPRQKNIDLSIAYGFPKSKLFHGPVQNGKTVQITPLRDSFVYQPNDFQKQIEFNLYKLLFPNAAAVIYNKKMLMINCMIIDEAVLEHFLEMADRKTVLSIHNIEVQTQWP